MNKNRSSEVANSDAERLIAEAVAIREELLVTAARLSVFSDQMKDMVDTLREMGDVKNEGKNS